MEAKEISHIKIEVTLKRCVELMRFLPLFRKCYWFVMILLPFASLYFYLQAKKEIDQAQEYSDSSLILVLLTAIIVQVVVYLFLRNIPNTIGKKLYLEHRRQNKMHLYIEFDRKEKILHLGTNQARLNSNQELQVASTPDNYLFYNGNGLKAQKFFLPKKGDAFYESIIKEIIDSLKEEGINIKQF